MGHKVHPLGFRIGVTKGWRSRWFATKDYAKILIEDVGIRKTILTKTAGADISLVEIDRSGKEISVAIHTARPGIIIGRGGHRVDELRQVLETLTKKKVRLNIQEVREPELDAFLVARNVAMQLEKRVAYRRAMKQAVARTMERGAKGIRIISAGRLGGAEIARRESTRQGRVPLHTLRADIDFGMTEARTPLGRIGIKVWIYKGDILPEVEEPEAVEAARTPEAGPVAQAAKAAPVEAVAPVAALRAEEKSATT
ncbi:MAG: 30S ribosomal protein S3 [Dehalococcoidia bacterium]|nr:30S ribosomal protein S3 [Dehalococcoidia bacterium]